MALDMFGNRTLRGWLDLLQHELRGALLHLSATDPGSPLEGQIWYRTDLHAPRYFDGTIAQTFGAGGGGGSGDVTGPASSVDSEIALFSLTTGKVLKRATGTGLAKLTSGVLSIATASSDYAPATSGVAILKGNGTGGFAGAAAGTDYAPATSGTGLLKGNGAGGFSTAVADTDYATPALVDARAQGITGTKQAVLVASTGNLALTGNQTIDTVSVPAGSRVLAKDQTTPAQNGIWVTAAGAWTRAADADASGELRLGTLVFVTAGTGGVNAGTQWVVNAIGADPWVPGSSSSTWAQFSGASATTAGAGLVATGNAFDVATNAGSGIVVNANDIAIDTAIIARVKTFNVGDGAASTFNLPHNWATRKIVGVSVRRKTTPWDKVDVYDACPDTNNVSIDFNGYIPSNNEFEATVSAVV